MLSTSIHTYIIDYFFSMLSVKSGKHYGKSNRPRRTVLSIICLSSSQRGPGTSAAIKAACFLLVSLASCHATKARAWCLLSLEVNVSVVVRKGCLCLYIFGGERGKGRRRGRRGRGQGGEHWACMFVVLYDSLLFLFFSSLFFLLFLLVGTLVL